MNRKRIEQKRRKMDINAVLQASSHLEAKRAIEKVRDNRDAFRLGALNLQTLWDECGQNPLKFLKFDI